jgi:hypothetical protein
MRAMEPFLCARHHAVASNTENGWRLCVGCFQEAKAKAEDKALEDRITALRLGSADALIRRLNGR